MYRLLTLRSQMIRLCNGFADNQRGATAIEYALIVAGVGIAIAATFFGMGSQIQDTLNNKLLSLL